MRRTLAIVLFVCICLGVPASADVPKLLSYQGVLTDAGGVAVSDGPYNITFRIYDVPSGGSALWTETDAVQVGKGIFSATLGNVTPLTSLNFDKAYYLSISVGGGVELPRQPLTASPYSLNAQAVVGTTNVFPSSGNVGIGTTTPTGPLQVQTSDIRGIRLDGTAAGAWSLLRINAAGVNSSPGIELCTQNAAKTIMYVGTGDDWHLQMTGTDGIVVSGSTRNVGLGMATPLERLDVAGGVRLGTTAGAHAGTIRWSGSDFEGYDGATWKSLTGAGVATLPTGTTGQTLRNSGSNWVAASNLYNDGTNVGIGTTSPTAKLQVGGGVNIGTMTADGDLALYHSGSSNAALWAHAANYGGGFYGYDPNGNMAWALENGGTSITTGRLALFRSNSPADFGVFIDANSDGFGNGYMVLAGASQGVVMQMNVTGDASVQLPVGAISSSEILDEPGIANYATTLGAALTASFAPYASQTINAPAAGYVLVMGTADVSPNHTSGIPTNIVVSVSASPTSAPATQNIWLYLPAAMPTSTYHYPVTVSGMFQVAAGSNTFYLDAEVTNGVGSIFERNLSIIYVPTAYGSFIAPLTAVSGSGAKGAPTGGALTASDIAATTRASEAANAERIQKELDTVKAQMAALKEQMKKMQDRK